MVRRKPVLFLLCITVLAPIILYTDKLASTSYPTKISDFVEDASNRNIASDVEKLHALPQCVLVGVTRCVEGPVGIVYLGSSSNSAQISLQQGVDTLAGEGFAVVRSGEHKSRVLSATDEEEHSDKEAVIEQVTSVENGNDSLEKHKPLDHNNEEGSETSLSRIQNATPEKQSEQLSVEVHQEQQENKISTNDLQISSLILPDAQVRQLKDQLIRAKVYLGLASTRSNPHFIRELRVRIREVQRALGDATRDSELPKNINEKLRIMEQTLLKGKQIQDDYAGAIKKLRAMLHSMEDQLRVHRKQTLFLTQLAAKTLPKGLHCLPLRLSTEYYLLEPSQRNRDRLLWKLGTLPAGLITFWKRTFPIDRSWHVLGLGYNPNVSHKDIGRAAVIHYNGNMKPWLEISMPKYRQLWAKYVDYDQVYLRDCNITP